MCLFELFEDCVAVRLKLAPVHGEGISVLHVNEATQQGPAVALQLLKQGRGSRPCNLACCWLPAKQVVHLPRHHTLHQQGRVVQQQLSRGHPAIGGAADESLHGAVWREARQLQAPVLLNHGAHVLQAHGRAVMVLLLVRGRGHLPAGAGGVDAPRRVIICCGCELHVTDHVPRLACIHVRLVRPEQCQHLLVEGPISAPMRLQVLLYAAVQVVHKASHVALHLRQLCL
mmetsp:Transcript_16167/g.35021  ORF Transcript_16167/g.35021 Transcript_16167/m.35021 type:complete len:229 (-) Transcript_16167:33-719(-)